MENSNMSNVVKWENFEKVSNENIDKHTDKEMLKSQGTFEKKIFKEKGSGKFYHAKHTPKTEYSLQLTGSTIELSECFLNAHFVIMGSIMHCIDNSYPEHKMLHDKNANEKKWYLLTEHIRGSKHYFGYKLEPKNKVGLRFFKKEGESYNSKENLQIRGLIRAVILNYFIGDPDGNIENILIKPEKGKESSSLLLIDKNFSLDQYSSIDKKFIFISSKKIYKRMVLHKFSLLDFLTSVGLIIYSVLRFGKLDHSILHFMQYQSQFINIHEEYIDTLHKITADLEKNLELIIEQCITADNAAEIHVDLKKMRDKCQNNIFTKIKYKTFIHNFDKAFSDKVVAITTNMVAKFYQLTITARIEKYKALEADLTGIKSQIEKEDIITRNITIGLGFLTMFLVAITAIVILSEKPRYNKKIFLPIIVAILTISSMFFLVHLLSIDIALDKNSKNIAQNDKTSKKSKTVDSKTPRRTMSLPNLSNPAEEKESPAACFN